MSSTNTGLAFVAQARTFAGATYVVDWQKDGAVAQFARSNGSSTWLFAEACNFIQTRLRENVLIIGPN